MLRLQDLAALSETMRMSSRGLSEYVNDDRVRALRWPEDVVEQLLLELADHEGIQRDYGHLDLALLAWTVEVLPTATFMTIPGTPSLGDCIERFAENPEHWVSSRVSGRHVGVREMWETHGTWKRWPILIDRVLTCADTPGLRVVEGHTRVGVLRGRTREGRRVADAHLAWVGRARV
jgi:hypothetical protein